MEENKVKILKDIQEVLLKGIQSDMGVWSNVAELAKAYAMIDAQIISRQEKEMEWDD